MKRKQLTVFLLLGAILLVASTGCKKTSTTESEPEPTPKPTDTSHVVVYKPNIYLYPQIKSVVSVKLEFPYGGTIIASIPDYLGEWRIEAEPTGKIENQYDYLFYESDTPDLYQYNSGWIVSRDSLFTFFKNNLSVTGFKESEISDFTMYWVPRLTNHKFYIIYPQYTDDINKVIKLKISPLPDNTIRLFYVIKGTETNGINLATPIIPNYKRDGFVVAEWGVVQK